MKRRSLLKGMALLPTLPLLGHAPLSLAQAIASSVTPLNKPHSDWRGLLTPEAYAVLFDEDTATALRCP